MKNKYIFTLSCLDQLGIIGKVGSILSKNEGFILESSQYGDPNTNQFFMRCVFTIDKKDLSRLEKDLLKSLEGSFSITPSEKKPNTVILATKEGACLNHLLYRAFTNVLPITIKSIISNHTYLKPMADIYHVPFVHLPIDPNQKAGQEEKILEEIQKQNAEIVVLARYMQILSPHLTEKLKNIAINIHHSFLPSFKGAKPYHQAFDRGVKLIGATAHYVTNALDEGPIIEQEVIRVEHSFLPKELIVMGSEIESRVLAKAIKYHAEKRVFLNGGKTVVFK